MPDATGALLTADWVAVGAAFAGAVLAGGGTVRAGALLGVAAIEATGAGVCGAV